MWNWLNLKMSKISYNNFNKTKNTFKNIKLNLNQSLSVLCTSSYEINKNFKGQNNKANFSLNICKKWTIKTKNNTFKKAFYDFLKMSEVLHSFKRLAQVTQLMENKNISTLFATDDIENPGDTTYLVRNAAALANQSYFNDTYWKAGSITNGWWYDIKNKKHESSLIFLPLLENSLNCWRESQIITLPLASIGSLNTNIKQNVSYPVLGSFASNLTQTYFFTRLLALLCLKHTK